MGAVILAAGASQRMGRVDKTFASLLGKPLILHTLDVFLRCNSIAQIVLVLPKSNIEKARTILRETEYSSYVCLCEGGRRRQDSARQGLSALEECQWAVVHDGARPCIHLDTLERGIWHAREYGNAVAAVPVTDTIKIADAQGSVTKTLPRLELRAIQTPQIFPLSQLREAYDQHQEEDFTDDAALVERLGGKVRLYDGSHENIKVTTPQDLALAELILSGRVKSR